ARAGVANVRLACTDARWLLKQCVASDSVQALHIYFPDPWWKQRHQKRKLFTTEFALECGRVLVPGGILHFATDVEEYFEQTCGETAGVAAIDSYAARHGLKSFCRSPAVRQPCSHRNIKSDCPGTRTRLMLGKVWLTVAVTARPAGLAGASRNEWSFFSTL